MPCWKPRAKHSWGFGSRFTLGPPTAAACCSCESHQRPPKFDPTQDKGGRSLSWGFGQSIDPPFSDQGLQHTSPRLFILDRSSCEYPLFIHTSNRSFLPSTTPFLCLALKGIYIPLAKKWTGLYTIARCIWMLVFGDILRYIQLALPNRKEA